LKIWRYMDLPKFVNMLATNMLYFTCISGFKDPYEGWLPRSYMEAMVNWNRTYLEQMRQTKNNIIAHKPAIDSAQLGGCTVLPGAELSSSLLESVWKKP
jgi:hypothetical protein